MRLAFIENEYDIELGTCFYIEKPIIKKDWLYLILYFDELYSLLSGDNYEKYNLITFREFPIEIVNRKFKQKSPIDHVPLELNIIDYCDEKEIMYIKPIHFSERDKFLYTIEKNLPHSLPFLKKTYLTLDILDFFVTNYISDIGNKLNTDLLFELADFKNSDLGKAFKEGIDFLVEKYSPNYYLTPPIEKDLKDFFLREQNELLKNTNIEEIKTFDLTPLIDDGVGFIGSLIFPILPLGTIKEIFAIIKKNKKLKDNKFQLFVLSLFYIQKLISKYTIGETDNIKCNICSLTISEIDKMTDEQAHSFVLSHTLGFCYNHLVSYLMIRKFKRLTGKALLINLKKDG